MILPVEDGMEDPARGGWDGGSCQGGWDGGSHNISHCNLVHSFTMKHDSWNIL